MKTLSQDNIFPTNILEQISKATVFNFKYFSSDISYQAYIWYVSVCGYEVSFR